MRKWPQWRIAQVTSKRWLTSIWRWIWNIQPKVKLATLGILDKPMQLKKRKPVQSWRVIIYPTRMDILRELFWLPNEEDNY